MYHFYDLKLLTIFGDLELEREKIYQKKTKIKRSEKGLRDSHRVRCLHVVDADKPAKYSFSFTRIYKSGKSAITFSFQFENVFKFSQKNNSPNGLLAPFRPVTGKT